MRALLVVNPQATSTTQAGKDVLAHALASELKLDVLQTAYRGHAAEAAVDAAVDGFDLIVVHGGDGTVNEVINGVLRYGARQGLPGTELPAIGVVPGGLANVFARALGLSRDPIEATRTLLHAVETGRSRLIGLGTVWTSGMSQPHWFTFNSGVGWDADVVAAVDRSRATGREASNALYSAHAVRQYLRVRVSRPVLRIRCDSADEVHQARMALVCNTSPWTYLGRRPIRTNPGCTFDGGLSLFALRGLGLPSVLRAVRQAMSRRPDPRGRNVLRFDDVNSIVVTSERPLNVQVDGDRLEPSAEVRYSSVPRALRVVV